MAHFFSLPPFFSFMRSFEARVFSFFFLDLRFKSPADSVVFWF